MNKDSQQERTPLENTNQPDHSRNVHKFHVKHHHTTKSCAHVNNGASKTSHPLKILPSTSMCQLDTIM
jgi:hypothetical protein